MLKIAWIKQNEGDLIFISDRGKFRILKSKAEYIGSPPFGMIEEKQWWWPDYNIKQENICVKCRGGEVIINNNGNLSITKGGE